jgi:hypothetical protein
MLAINILPFLNLIFFISVMILMFFNLKFTIQRFYDLNLSGWYILLKLIPIFSIFVNLYLYFKKGNREINDYDKAVNYRKLFKPRHCIDVYKDKFIIDGEIYQYELYLGIYSIKLSEYGQNNFFKEYLLNNYQYEKNNIYKIIKCTENELTKIINVLGLIVINDSFYLQLNNHEIFIRKENFKYTIILNKERNTISKALFDFFDFPGLFFEDEVNIYYNGIYKENLVAWVKNVA